MEPLPADALLILSASPLALVVVILAVSVVLARRQVREARTGRPLEADAAFWAAARLDQITREAAFGTRETPVVETVSLYTATLSETLEYLRAARDRRRVERREFGAIMRGARTA